MKPLKLPSQFQIGQRVTMRAIETSPIYCIVHAVKFTESKVFYSLLIPESETIIDNVDSVHVFKK